MGEEARFGETEEPEFEAVFGFHGIMSGSLPDGVFGRPWSGMGGPLDGIVLEDECGSGEVAG